VRAMAEFATAEKDYTSIYKLMIGCIVPRPIAFVSTVSLEGVANLAPFSFFNGICYDPPTVIFSVIDREGERKDTARNIEVHPEFIVHIVSEAIAERMNVTCGDYGAHISEFVEAGFTALPGARVHVPRVAEAQVAMECRLARQLRVGNAPHQSSLILGEVLYWHVQDAIFGPKGRIDPEALRAIGRMGGIEYCKTRDRFEMARPVIPDEDPRSIAAYRRMRSPSIPTK
jgi:flavin reductase (DIM6/NTAB) family NADH-FMN oxidoreductase RutF